MFGIGTGELLLLAIIALLVLGPERMPKLMRDIGRTVGDLRRTSDELRGELLSADQAIRREISLEPAAKKAPVAPAAAPGEGRTAAAGATLGATQAEVTTQAGVTTAAEVTTAADVTTPAEPVPAAEAEAAAASEPDETAFDREARLARERLEDPEERRVRDERAAGEGWKVPTDDAGTSPREG